MILVYQIFHGLLNIDASFFFSQLLAHLQEVTNSNYIRRVLKGIHIFEQGN